MEGGTRPSNLKLMLGFLILVPVTQMFSFWENILTFILMYLFPVNTSISIKKIHYMEVTE